MSKYKMPFADKKAPALFSKRPSEGESVYSLVILYQNSEARNRTDRFSEDLIREIGGNMLWNKEEFDLDFLGLPISRRKVTVTAAISDLLILSLNGDTPLSDDFKAWMEEWAAHLYEHSPVLIAHFNAYHDQSEADISNRVFLSTIVEVCGLTFLYTRGDQIIEYPPSSC